MSPTAVQARFQRRIDRTAQGMLSRLDNFRQSIRRNYEKMAEAPDDAGVAEQCTHNIRVLKNRYRFEIASLRLRARPALPGRVERVEIAGIPLVAIPGGFVGKRIVRRAA